MHEIRSISCKKENEAKYLSIKKCLTFWNWLIDQPVDSQYDGITGRAVGK